MMAFPNQKEMEFPSDEELYMYHTLKDRYDAGENLSELCTSFEELGEHIRVGSALIKCTQDVMDKIACKMAELETLWADLGLKW